MKVRFNGGIKDVPLSEVNAGNYIVPQREERFYHVIQEKVEFDRNTGKRKSQPVLQKYDTKCYPATSKYLRDAGYTITVLHDPIDWERKHQEAKQRSQAIAAQAQAKRQASEREAMKAQIRAEILAELKAEMKQDRKASKNNK